MLYAFFSLYLSIDASCRCRCKCPLVLTPDRSKAYGTHPLPTQDHLDSLLQLQQSLMAIFDLMDFDFAWSQKSALGESEIVYQTSKSVSDLAPSGRTWTSFYLDLRCQPYREFRGL